MGMLYEVRFCEVDLDPAILMGMCRVFQVPAPYTSNSDYKTVAEIYCSQRLSHPWKRLVTCKELLHCIDCGEELAQTPEQVEKLIQELVVPHSLATSIPGISDRDGMLNALKVLLPRDALDELSARHEQGKISEDDIASLAQIPSPFVRFALTPRWRSIVDGIG